MLPKLLPIQFISSNVKDIRLGQRVKRQWLIQHQAAQTWKALERKCLLMRKFHFDIGGEMHEKTLTFISCRYDAYCWLW